MSEIVPREDITEDLFKEILEKEKHHNHVIIKDDDGTLRWEHDPLIQKLIDPELISLNDLLPKMMNKGMGKNSEEYRELYRKIGYSLYGYWEIFYWEANNEEAEEYNGK